MTRNNKPLTMEWLQNRALNTKLVFAGLAIFCTLIALGLLVYAMLSGLTSDLTTLIKIAGAFAVGLWMVYFSVAYSLNRAMKGK